MGSTIIRDDGIGKLAKFCGVEDALSELTQRAVGGAVPFMAALTEHLALIQPSRGADVKAHSRAPPTPDPGHKGDSKPPARAKCSGFPLIR